MKPGQLKNKAKELTAETQKRTKLFMKLKMRKLTNKKN